MAPHEQRWGHLAGRFFGALRPGGPTEADRAWVEAVLEPAEYGLWARQPGYDRRHSAEVARRVEAALAGGPHADDSRWLACALLHDIGKLAGGLGIPGRVLATLVGRATDGAVADPGGGGCPPDRGGVSRLGPGDGGCPPDRGGVSRLGPGDGGCPPDRGGVSRLGWEEHRGLRRRIALYLRHPELGADMIRLAGGRAEVAHWARAHHDRARLDPTLLPAPVVAALVAADND